jgi:anti-sigma regulatory factor (Ser/Thr protein kinase)
MAELILDAAADAVPVARRFAKIVLAGLAAELVGDVELVVAELVTNAALHGQPPVVMGIAASGDRVRLEVEDSGRALPMEVVQRLDAMTGRGLSIVAALTSSWGVEARHSGKVVWAEFVAGSERTQSRAAPDMDRDAILAAWPDEDGDLVPRYTVRLEGIPTQLLLAAKVHIDNVVREMALLGSGSIPAKEELSESARRLIEAVTVDFAEARTEIKRQALDADARGRIVTDLELRLPVDAADAGERYLSALDEADRYARSARLLTMAAPASHRVLRQWYVRSVVDQLRAQARGLTPPPPLALASVLAAEVDRLSRLEDVATRLDLLQRVNSRLAAAASEAEMAAVVVELAAQYVGVEGVRVFLATDSGTFRSAAWHTGQNETPESYEEFAPDADLPGATVVRTGKPLFLKSRHEIYDLLPELEGYYPDERTLHVLPVALGARTLGLLGITFLGGQLGDDDQLQFVNALADVLAQALARVQQRH